MSNTNYGIGIPVEVYGQNDVKQMYDAIRNLSGATSGLSKEKQQLIKDIRDEVNATGNLNKALNDIRKGYTGASDGVRTLAGQIQAYTLKAREAEAQTARLDQAVGKIGGRLGGSMLMPGGGFMGSQLVGALGLSGGTALGLGVAAGGIFAAVDFTKKIADLGKWVQEQQNAARAVGITTSQMESLTRVSERTGTNLEAAAKATANLSDELWKGGARAKDIQTALAQLNLPQSTAFKNPADALNDISTALVKITDQSSRLSIAKELYGELGTSIAAVADQISQTHDVSIFSAETNQELIDAKNAVKDLGDAWDMLLGKLATPATFLLKGAQGIINFTQLFTGLGLQGKGEQGAGVSDEDLARMQPAESARRLAYSRSVTSSTGTPEEQYQAQMADLNQQKDKLMVDYKSGDIYRDSEFKSGYVSVTGKIAAAEQAKKVAEERARQREQLQRQISEGAPEDFMDAGRMAQHLPKEFEMLTGDKQYQSWAGQLQSQYLGYLPGSLQAMNQLPLHLGGSQMDVGGAGLLGYNLTHLKSESDKFNEEAQKAKLKGESEDRESKLRSVSEQYDTSIGGIKGDSDLSAAQARYQSAIRSGRLSTLGASGLNAPLLAQMQLQASLADIQGTSGAKMDETQNTIYALTGKAQGIANTVGGSAGKDYAEIQRQLQEKLGELQQQKIDMETKSVDALSKFNEAIERTRKQIEDEFGSGFASLVMGAQNGGARGVQGALKSWGEGQETTILKNIGGMIFQNSGITGVSQNSPFANILKGTIFGPQGQQQLITANVDNTTATVANTAAITKLSIGAQSANGTAAAGDMSGGGSLDDMNALPWTTGAATSIYGLTGSVASAGSFGTSLAPTLAAAGGIFGKLAGVLGGVKYVGNLGATFTGTAYNPNGTPASVYDAGTTSDGTELQGYDAGSQYTELSGAQQVGAIAGTAGAALATYQGIATATKGGAKNVLGGTGETLMAIAPFTGPAAPFVAAAGAIASTVSALLPNLQAGRTNQIQKALFYDQYLAPQALNVSQGANGGYADVDQNGNVRSSNFSPYPIVTSSYLDTGRGNRIVVPGHQLSSFGGSGSVGGQAKNPQVPTYNISIQAMDSKSIVDNHQAIGDALHMALSKGHPSLVTGIRNAVN